MPNLFWRSRKKPKFAAKGSVFLDLLGSQIFTPKHSSRKVRYAKNTAYAFYSSLGYR